MSEAEKRLTFKPSEVSHILGLSIQTIYRMIGDGSLLAIDCRPPGSPRAHYGITRAALDAFIEGNRRAPASRAAAR